MESRKKNLFVAIFDGFVNVTWRICRILGGMIVKICSGIAHLIAKTWSATDRLPYGSRVCAEIAGLFRGIGRGLRIILYPLTAIGNKIITSADQSLPMRRLVVSVLLLAVIIFYWFFTPFWPYGTWYAYENGKASWYGGKFYFRRTASGEWFLPGPFYTAAHKTLPLGTKVLVVNSKTLERVVVRVNDRGPFVEERIIDLTYAAAKKIGVYQPGTANVTIYTRKPRHKNSRRIFVTR